MKRLVLIAGLTALLAGSVAAKSPAPENLQIITLPGQVLHHVVLPQPDGGSRLLAWTLPDEADNEESAECESSADNGVTVGTPIVWSSGEQTVQTEETTFQTPPQALGRIDIDGDGNQEGIVWKDGGWWVWPGRAELPHGSFGPDWTLPPLLTGSSKVDPWVLQRPGTFARVIVEEGHLKAGKPTPLPATLYQYQGTWSLSSPVLRSVKGDPTGRLIAGPERRGAQRLRTRLIDPDGLQRETWSLLPEPEAPMKVQFMTGPDGEPRLLVLTAPTKNTGLFGEQRLRIFSLNADRTRLGSPPQQAWLTNANYWQQISFVLEDLDGDGTTDLALMYWKGLTSDKLVIDIHSGKADGTFSTSPKTQSFKVKDGDRSWVLLEDLDGDGHRDLLLRGGKKMMMWPGQSARDGIRWSNKSRRQWSIRDGGETGDSELIVSSGGGLSGGSSSSGLSRPRLLPRADGSQTVLWWTREGAPRLIVLEP
jgi:hypothetical protein